MSLFFKGVFRQSKPRGMKLQHRYYDERKERIEKLKKAHSEKEEPAYLDKDKYREHLSDSWSQRRLTSGKSNNTWRILLIFAALLLLTYFFLLG